MKAYMKIRDRAKNSGVRLWQIADAIGIQESMFSKKLRNELPEDEQERILAIIDKLAKERQEVA